MYYFDMGVLVFKEDMTMPANRDLSVMRLTKQNSFTRYHGHDFYEFFFLSDGSLTENRNGRRYVLKTGDSLLIRPGDFHGYPEWRKEEFVFYNLTIRKSLWKELERLSPTLPFSGLTRAEQPRFLNLQGDDFEFCRYTLDWLIRLENESSRRQGCLNFLSRMVLQFWGESHPFVSEGAPLWFNRLMNRLDEQNTLKEGTGFFKEASPVSYEHLSRLFKKHTGQSPSAFIRSRRIALARTLLVGSDLTVGEVAEECGYENLSHFHHQFRSDTGESPLRYRKKHSGFQ